VLGRRDDRRIPCRHARAARPEGRAYEVGPTRSGLRGGAYEVGPTARRAESRGRRSGLVPT
jgi:hypothetical protein